MSNSFNSSSIINQLLKIIVEYKNIILCFIGTIVISIIGINILVENKYNSMINTSDILLEIYDTKTPTTRREQLNNILQQSNIVTTMDHINYCTNYISGKYDCYQRNINLLKFAVDIYVNGLDNNQIIKLDYYNEAYDTNRFSIVGQLLLLLKAENYYNTKQYQNCIDLSFSNYIRHGNNLPYHILYAKSLHALKTYGEMYYTLNMVGYSRDTMTQFCRWLDIIGSIYSKTDSNIEKQKQQLLQSIMQNVKEG